MNDLTIDKEYRDRRDKTVNLAFARRLRALRRAMSYGRGPGELTTGGMADLLGVEHERYRRWERGEIAMPLHILAKLRKICGVSLDLMIAGEPPGDALMIPADGLGDGEPTLGMRLMVVRDLAEPDIAECAKVMGVSRSTWEAWEADYGQPPIGKMLEFAHRFGVTLDFLYSGELRGLSEIVRKQILRHKRYLAARSGRPLRPHANRTGTAMDGGNNDPIADVG